MVGTAANGPGVVDALAPIYAMDEGDLRDAVRSALAEDRAMLAYQPVVLVSGGRPAFHEGMIRLRDAAGVLLPAGRFVPAVEATPLGRVLDATSLGLGLAQLARSPGLRLSINMSARSIGSRRWRDALEAGLARDETVAERLIIEVTESSTMRADAGAQDFMAEMQCRGISVALDDFGAGETCFRYLHEFAFDILKVDGAFVQGCDRDADRQRVLEAIVAVGRQFDMLTVAERVETPGEAAFLARAGFDCLQGFLYGPPSTRAAFDAVPSPADWIATRDRRVGGFG